MSVKVDNSVQLHQLRLLLSLVRATPLCRTLRTLSRSLLGKNLWSQVFVRALLVIRGLKRAITHQRRCWWGATIVLFILIVIIVPVVIVLLTSAGNDGNSAAFQWSNDSPALSVSSETSSAWAFDPDGRFEDPLVYPSPPEPSQCEDVPEERRFDCYPQDGGSEESCEKRGCCWRPAEDGARMSVPWCYYPQLYNGYFYVNVSETAAGISALLRRTTLSGYPNDISPIQIDFRFESESRLHVKIFDPRNERYEVPIPPVPDVRSKAKRLHYGVKLSGNSMGFQVYRKHDDAVIFDSMDIGALVFSDQFLQISGVLPSSNIYGLGEHQDRLRHSTYWRQYTLFAHDEPPRDSVSHDEPPRDSVSHDEPPRDSTNLYGSHPFYMVTEESGKSHGVFLLNSNAMGELKDMKAHALGFLVSFFFFGLLMTFLCSPDVILQPTPAITFRTIGGILDMYFFLGPSPGEVISQYTALIGRPFLPPYWSLGFHLCRWGWETAETTRSAWQRNIQQGVPIETMWNDLDYMDNRKDFAFNQSSFAGLPRLVMDLHDSGRHYVPLIDPGISSAEKPGTYLPFDEGIELDIFVKDVKGAPFEGRVSEVNILNPPTNTTTGMVWNPVSTVWPDFTNPKAVSYWTTQLRRYHDQVPIDGAWIDMNEPSNFYSGTKNGCPVTTWDNPPYLPAVAGGQLAYRTLCMTAQHAAGKHYDVHNIFGFSESVVTNFALKEIRGRRPFVISRSTFPGQGQYGGHWTGDVSSDWYSMAMTIPVLEPSVKISARTIREDQFEPSVKISARTIREDQFEPSVKISARTIREDQFEPSVKISARTIREDQSSNHPSSCTLTRILNMNMFGIPLVGSDICGFIGDTTVDLCQRWTELGAFYPFARNHNDKGSIVSGRWTVDQDPAALGPRVLHSAKKSLGLRYRLLPYLYSLFWSAHANGETVARPLFFEFPDDPETLEVDNAFMWGSGLLILPVLEEGATEIYRYLPAGVWYYFDNGTAVRSEGNLYTLQAPPGAPVLMMRGGSVIPTQGARDTVEQSSDVSCRSTTSISAEELGSCWYTPLMLSRASWVDRVMILMDSSTLLVIFRILPSMSLLIEVREFLRFQIHVDGFPRSPPQQLLLTMLNCPHEL
ncbi:unnamed protein product [Cyprideis torosa]|uniref:Uncharacterized protein n=1 Tax=Cyprideis torosa TaxID=163714 RepID=A0A7R8ZLB4_9CRUS|nr:unnamed protein product [Cyprideis torosa]CAG0893077.1 unnamed protein product [Cyprideis torosa]